MMDKQRSLLHTLPGFKYLLPVIGIFIAGAACSPDSGDNPNHCRTVSIHKENKDNDTTRVKVIRTVAFDTTAILVGVQVADRQNLHPLQDVAVTLFNDQEQYPGITDAKGELTFFRNLPHGQFHLKLERRGYKCLIIRNVILAGGQWLAIKLQPE